MIFPMYPSLNDVAGSNQTYSHYSKPGTSPDVSGGKSFYSVLSQQLQKSQDITSNLNNSGPVPQDSLKQIASLLDLQMKKSLFSALNNDDSDENIQFTPVSKLNRYGNLLDTLMSKIEQATQEKRQYAPQELDSIIDRASQQYGVSKKLIAAVIKAESNFTPDCTSPKGAMGLMQLMPDTAKELGVKNPYDPVENIMAGTRYLKGLLDRYSNNLSVALAAYNWGMGNVERSNGSLPRETVQYIARVMQDYRDEIA